MLDRLYIAKIVAENIS